MDLHYGQPGIMLDVFVSWDGQSSAFDFLKQQHKKNLQSFRKGFNLVVPTFFINKDPFLS